MSDVTLTIGMAEYPRNPMTVHWYARPDDVIGGWCVMPVDEPPSEGCYAVADFIGEEEARHVANLHNAWLDLAAAQILVTLHGAMLAYSTRKGRDTP